ncbi:hypothetical protein H1C71_002098, partial [Ictidomys tridecemlineatus]
CRSGGGGRALEAASWTSETWCAFDPPWTDSPGAAFPNPGCVRTRCSHSAGPNRGNGGGPPPEPSKVPEKTTAHGLTCRPLVEPMGASPRAGSRRESGERRGRGS